MGEEIRRALTLEDVASAAGVSRATASRALTGSDTTSTPARERVRAVAERMGYTPNTVARALAGGVGARVVVAASGPAPDVLDDPYMWRVLGATAAACDGEGIGVSLQWLPLDAPASLHRLAADRSVRGVVLVNSTERLLAELPDALRGRVASIGIGSADVPSFDVDNRAGAGAVVRHLHATGRRRIAMLAGPQWLPCSWRSAQVYSEVVQAAGLPVRVLPGDFGFENGRSGALEVLRRWPDTDAIFAICDAAALGAMAALRGLGVQVPGDVAVAGFDDLPVAAWSGPALTTATHPVTRIATGAATAVLAGAPAEGTTWYPSELVLRESA
ncbi:LacI family DNA-binding transcriptional regulator [Pseudonocardia xinjiangensis]|uniref:LacI family transcriptional regulator n=1 Tax=Pseudonocardia xinjiangensis TaxID=75289 RepID=A0ABX1RH23_9PSEU|nr:LacI family DNA-binding transcriptional regulator [Pseudonocardia xinjiangensis]NMH79692.1 LacI family transcriptional regulator [Pseudonocardia xinjiangensis]